MAFDHLFARMGNPPREFGMMPFWFWNDDLDENELLRQLHAFHAGGFGGVVIHPRVGLSARVGYLTETYFRLMRRVVDECAALGMKVILYDEGSYPSGSACGQVVAANPDYAARALILVQRDIAGPWRGYWRPAAGRALTNRLVCVVLARVEAGAVQAGSLTLLPTLENNLVRLDVGEGTWRVMACFDVPSGGHIRGVLPEHEDGLATAPPAGDLMNPEAVATFIRLTHDAYAAHLKEHLGTTVVGMFTDEPSPLGRGARRQAWPYTAGFAEWLAARLQRSLEEVCAWLPALWLDYGPETEAFRRAYDRGVHDRVREVFYAAQLEWCRKHRIALTGHPAASNDMSSLSTFDWPGQDVVWRWVVPGNASGVEGPDSVSAKAATSAARAGNRCRICTELFGAYGWGLTLDEAKWLLDWHLSRGNNLFVPHACFYSVRDGRAYESEPDVGLHNVWWPHFQQLADYAARMSWLLTDCKHICDVAVLGNGYRLPWAAAKILYENQVDFFYIDDLALRTARVADGKLHVGSQAYRAVVVDGDVELAPQGRAIMAAFTDAGGHIIAYGPNMDLVAQLRQALSPDVSIDPAAPGLRVTHICKDGLDIYALFNEGETPVEGLLQVAARGSAEWWDPLRLTRAPAQALPVTAALHSQGMAVRLSLPRRESRLLVVNQGAAVPVCAEWRPVTHAPRLATIDVTGPWNVYQDGRPVEAPAPGDWTSVRKLERFSGTLVYRTIVALPADVAAGAHSVEVDLGVVGEAASVAVNRKDVGWALWAPFRIVTPIAAWQPGDNLLEVQVTNSAANAYEGALRPSGLMGPIQLRLR